MLEIVSAIVAAYNASATLAETLESIASQTLLPDETIVVDDGSTDGTADIARSFAGRLPGLKVISTPNGGVSRARNTAIEASSGEYVAPLDADDLWHPTYLEKMVRRLEERPECGFAYAFLRRIDMSSVIVSEAPSYGVDGWGIHQFLARNFVSCGSNQVIRRRVLLQAGCYDPLASGTEDSLLQMAMCAIAPVTHVPEYLVGYRDVPNSLSKNAKKLLLNAPVAETHVARILPNLDPRAGHWIRARRHMSRFVTLRANGQVGLAGMLSAGRALLMDPFRWGFAAVWVLRQKLLPPRPADFIGRRFETVSPSARGTVPLNVAMVMRLAEARRMDEKYGAARAAGEAAVAEARPLLSS